MKFIFGSFIQFSDHLNKSFYCWRWTILIQMQSHPNIFVVLIITVRKTFSYLHHLKNLRMDLMQNLNQWQSLPVMDLPLIYNPKIKSIQTRKKKIGVSFLEQMQSKILYFLISSLHTQYSWKVKRRGLFFTIFRKTWF